MRLPTLSPGVDRSPTGLQIHVAAFRGATIQPHTHLLCPDECEMERDLCSDDCDMTYFECLIDCDPASPFYTECESQCSKTLSLCDAQCEDDYQFCCEHG